MRGATGKRLGYFFSSVCRGFGFIGLLIAYIVVRICVSPAIVWLNWLLLGLAIGSLVSGIFNLVLCGFNAISYREHKGIQIICFLVTLLTGGIFGSTFSGIASFTRVTDEDISLENVVKIKK